MRRLTKWPEVGWLSRSIAGITAAAALAFLVYFYQIAVAENNSLRAGIAAARQQQDRDQRDLQRLALQRWTRADALAEVARLRDRIKELTPTLAREQLQQGAQDRLMEENARLSNSVVKAVDTFVAEKGNARVLELTLLELMEKYNLPEKGPYLQARTIQPGDQVQLSVKLARALFGPSSPFVSMAGRDGFVGFGFSPEMWAQHGITDYGQLMILGLNEFRVIRSGPDASEKK